MSRSAAFVLQTGVVCPIGIGAAQASASFRAGLSAFAESSVYDSRFEPVRMALLPEDSLPPLADLLAERALVARTRRMLRLLAPALTAARSGLDPSEPLPLFLGSAEPNSALARQNAAELVTLVSTQAEVVCDEAQSAVFAEGRAAGLLALEAGCAALARGVPRVLVAGVDTFLDLRLLAELDREGRVLGSRVMDGFVPGEGAACLLLSRSPREKRAALCVRAVASVRDPGHRTGTAPALGEGLSRAVEALRSQDPALAPVATCFAGLNGESFGAKEWGVARIRHQDVLGPDVVVEHPADCFGDVGAAMGPLLLALADETLRSGDRAGPALVWASSDGEPCACAYVALT